MKRLIVDFSNLLWTSLLVGKDGENGRKIQHNGKEIYINSAQWGVDCAINNLVTCLETLSLVPSDIIFVVETGNSKARRQAMYKPYKQDREERHPLLKENFQKAKDEILTLFGNLGATWVTQPHTEGDDVIAYLAEHLGGEKIIYSTDGDLAQLLALPDVMLWKSGTLVASNPYGDFDPTYIRVMKALVGDGNEYPGCPKFGPKKWEALLERYGSALPVLDGWMETRNLDELKDDVADFPPFQLVLNNLDLVYTSYQLAKLRPDWVNLLRVPLQWHPGMVKPATDYRLKKWGAQGRTVTSANFGEALQFLKAKVRETREFCFDFETTTPEESDEWLAQRTEKGRGVDVIGSRIVSCGLSFGANGQYGLYFSVEHADTDNITMDQLAEVFETLPENKVKVAHNAAGFELPVAWKTFGERWKDNGWRGFIPNAVDSQIASTYWDENVMSAGLKPLSKQLLKYEQQTYAQTTTWVAVDGREMWLKDVPDGVTPEVLREFKMHELSAEHVFGYGIDDCYTAQGLYNFFKITMEMEGTFDAFMRIEQKPMYLSAWSYVEGTPISMERLLTLKKADEEAKVEHETTLHAYLIDKGWEGSVCPRFEELTSAAVKTAAQIILGDEMKTAVRTVAKLAKMVEALEHEDAPLLAQIIEGGDVAQINDWMAKRFVAAPDFNTGSFVQIGKLMYEVMGLPIRLRNKATDAMRAKGIREGSPQTDDDAINMAIKMGDAKGRDAEVLTALLELKSIKTRSSLYWEAYPKFLHWTDNLLHPEVRQCSTNTRRHTSANPNIQQQDSTQGGVRSVMKPHRRDAVFVSLDLAGQEIRLLGDYSRDENIMSAYIGDPPRDLHSFTAAMILGLSYEDFRARYESRDEAVAAEANLARQRGKTVFFASSYGAMAPKIALGLGISEELAQTYLDALDKAFPRVTPWKEETEAFVSTHGWVPVMGGTRRHLRELILSDDKWTASKALRQASNARIQGAGGNQIRTIMGRVWDSDLFERYDMRFYWPVHDELCFSVRRDHAVPVIQSLHKMMCEKFLDVLPSASSIGIGRTYGELIEIGEVADADLIEGAVRKAFGEVETAESVLV